MRHSIEEYLKVPGSFCYRGDLPLFRTWALGPVIECRDSSLRSKSNAAAMKAIFEEKLGPASDECDPPTGKWCVVSCNHWAVGWVEHLAFEVLTPEGEESSAVEVWEEIEAALADYPVLDENDYSDRQEAAVRADVEMALCELAEWELRLPDDWYVQLRDRVDVCDEAIVRQDDVHSAVLELGWLKCPCCEHVISSFDHECPSTLEEMVLEEP